MRAPKIENFIKRLHVNNLFKHLFEQLSVLLEALVRVATCMQNKKLANNLIPISMLIINQSFLWERKLLSYSPGNKTAIPIVS